MPLFADVCLALNCYVAFHCYLLNHQFPRFPSLPSPRESAPCNATNEASIVVENFIGDILTEVQNGLGYADARAKSNRIFFNAWLNGQTNGYSYGELVDIANCAIWQYLNWN